MDRQNSSSDLQRLLQAIHSSDVVESRIQLLTELGDLTISEESDVASLVDCLAIIWDDFTCLDVSQCMLNKTILHVAAKYLDSDLSRCLVQFLTLGTKASIWCVKHLKMTLMSTNESQEEEHHSLFFQLLLDFLSFSGAGFAALIRHPVSCDEAEMVVVEKFILENLSLIQDAVSESKRISSCGSEVLKLAQMVIDAAIKLCREYCQAVNWECCDAKPEKDKTSKDFEESNKLKHVTNIIKCTIEKLTELGILAANDGGSLVTILNVSWKAVVTLLQHGKGALAVKVNVADIVLNLISLVNESLRCAAQAWSSTLEETISVNEARRIFVPVKFYLINAIKISSLYPGQAYAVYKEITLCVLMISTLRIILSHENLLKAASEVLVELLEKTTLDLLSSLLNSAQLTPENKFEILDYLFTDEWYSIPAHGDPIGKSRKTSINEILTVSFEAMPRARELLVGRVALFQSFLKHSLNLDEDVKLMLARKLGWLLNVLIDEDIYSSILVLQVPELYSSGKTTQLIWQPMLSVIMHALKTFMVVVSSCLAWGEVESFLLENFFDPHFLSWEIVMELWCFLLRYAEKDVVNGIIGKLCSLMKLLVSSESVFYPSSNVRKIARSICMLLTHSTPSIVEKVYHSILNDYKDQSSIVMYIALLLEGFPVNLLSDNMKNIVKKEIITDYFDFIENIDDKLLGASCIGVFGAPVFVLSACLQSLELSESDIGVRTLKFLVTIIHNYRNTVDKSMKDQYRKILAETLRIISNLKYLYVHDEMEEGILELQKLFISGSAASDTQLCLCKPELALFIEGLGHMEMSESEECAKSCAVWDLYHMLLRERNWALVHLAVSAFGYFAARTSCNQLWKFVPQDAALSYDLLNGDEFNVERFMSEFRAFLEKEKALLVVTPSSEQLGQLLNEGQLLKEMVHSIKRLDVKPEQHETMEMDSENQSNKRRKFPDGISRGMELLQNGLKEIGNGISQWQQNKFESTEFQDRFLAQFSRLEDVIVHLTGLAGS